MIKGQPVFDGLAVMEFSANFLGAVELNAKAAFVQTADVGERKGGATHGSTTCTRWSDTTLKKLDELKAAMEQDLARRHFYNAPRADDEVPGGIAEGLGDEDGIPQV